MGDIINPTEIRKAIKMLCDPAYPFEIRIVRNGRKNGGISGYFMDADTLLKQFESVDLRSSNIYITLNALKPELYSREQADRFREGVPTTSDNDIEGYQWMLIDLDPERSTGISSSDAELKEAYALSRTVRDYLRDKGFSDPIDALSGNGIHLLYKIELKNNPEMVAVVEKCLKVLDALFSNDKVKIDTVVYNPSRISKLYGTLAQKGRSSKDRPHRMSRILSEDVPIKPTKLMYLQALANEVIAEPIEAPAKYNNYRPKEFDIENWLSEHGIRYRATRYKDGEKFVLDECPFDSSHKAPDSSVFRTSSGAIGFKCLHNSCSCYKWKDLRLKFEPDAYEQNTDDSRIEAGWQQHNRDKKVVVEDKGPMFETAMQIFERPEPDHEFIPTGINKLDKAIRGLEKGKLSILTGLRGSAKSTLLSQFILNAINNGHRCICYSGELSDKSFMNWMWLQAAGKHNVLKSARFEGFYSVPDDIKKSISYWMSDKLLVYNNNYGHKWDKLLGSIRNQVESSKADMVLLDNLMTLDLSQGPSDDKYELQTRFIQSLKVLAMDSNTHIMFVAHPRKQEGLLRLDSVAGSGNLTNYVDTAMIIHRVNEDFKNNAKKTFGWKDDAVMLSSRCSNALEVAKDRESGTCDYWVDLYYEPESKRLKNYNNEVFYYGWDKPQFEGFHSANDIDF